MKVTIADDDINFYGQYVACYVKGADANLRKTYEELWNNRYLQGYKLVAVFDLTIDEWEQLPAETPIYYMDSITEEVLEYSGVDVVIRWLESKGYDVVKTSERKNNND